MGAWEEQRAQWGGPDWMPGAAGGFALDYLDAPEPVKTGIHAVDSVTGGLPAGEVTVLAGDAGMGKTALACQLAYHAAMRGMRPIYCSFEMSRLKCLMRMVACHAALHPELTSAMPERSREVFWSGARPHPDALAQVSSIRQGAATQDEADRQVALYARAYGKQMAGTPPDAAMLAWSDMDAAMRSAGGILVADSMRSLADIESCVSACAEDGAGGLVVVDYAQLVETGDEKEYDRIATLSTGLRRIAKSWRIALLVISALRKLSGSDRKEGPAMDWLKGNNALAYDAGQVLFLLRPDGEDAMDGSVRNADLAVVKNRNGASGGRCELSYDAPRNVIRSRFLAPGACDSIGLWA